MPITVLYRCQEAPYPFFRGPRGVANVCGQTCTIVHTNTNQIYNVHEVTLNCESEVQIVSHQVKIQLTFQFLESQEEIVNFEPLFEGRFEL